MLLTEGHRLEGFILSLSPFPDDIERGILERLKKVAKILLAGNFLVMFLQGLMVFIGLIIVKAPISVLLSLIAALFSLIPIVGTAIVWLPVSIYFVISGAYSSAVFITIIYKLYTLIGLIIYFIYIFVNDFNTLGTFIINIFIVFLLI